MFTPDRPRRGLPRHDHYTTVFILHSTPVFSNEGSIFGSKSAVKAQDPRTLRPITHVRIASAVFDAPGLGYFLDELFPNGDVFLEAFDPSRLVFVVNDCAWGSRNTQTDQGLDQLQFASLAVPHSGHPGYCAQGHTFSQRLCAFSSLFVRFRHKTDGQPRLEGDTSIDRPKLWGSQRRGRCLAGRRRAIGSYHPAAGVLNRCSLCSDLLGRPRSGITYG